MLKERNAITQSQKRETKEKKTQAYQIHSGEKEKSRNKK